jgi:hypothetical protein
MDGLRGNEDKVRIILNKADNLSTQNLMRVYGALLWSLSRVFRTPEVSRVYIGSFWSEPIKSVENKVLFEQEMSDLLKELGFILFYFFFCFILLIDFLGVTCRSASSSFCSKTGQ